MSKENKELIVGLDIGTSKIVAIVAELTADGKLNILGIGSKESKGLKKGMVVNIEATVNAISRAIQEVELLSHCKVKSVFTGIAGSHIKSKDSDGMVVVREKEVTQLDVQRAIEAAQATPISADDRLLHTLVQEFIVDGQDGVKEPIGMDAKRLEVRVHIVTGAVTSVQNIVKCVHRCGLEVADLVLQPLASGHAVLTDDEKDVGVCLVDIGGGTTDIAIFAQGAIRHTAVIPIAGDQITNDIAIAFRTSTQDAESIKLDYGVALQQLADADEKLEVPGVGDRPSTRLSRQTLASVIQPRAEEIFLKVQDELRKSGLERLLRAGIVLTGGASAMSGMTQLGEEIFHNTVKLGVPAYAGKFEDVVRNPRYSTAMGLLQEGMLQKKRGLKVQGPKNFGQILARMRNWFEKNF